MNSIEIFKSLGGTFEVSGEWIKVVFNDMDIHLPSKYFASTNEAEQECVDYYLDAIPKIYNNRQQSVVGFPEDLDLLTTCGTFNTEDCISAEDLGKLIIKKAP